MKRFEFNKTMVESPLPPKDTNMLWVDKDENTGKVASIKEFKNGEWVTLVAADGQSPSDEILYWIFGADNKLAKLDFPGTISRMNIPSETLSGLAHLYKKIGSIKFNEGLIYISNLFNYINLEDGVIVFPKSLEGLSHGFTYVKCEEQAKFIFQSDVTIRDFSCGSSTLYPHKVYFPSNSEVFKNPEMICGLAYSYPGGTRTDRLPNIYSYEGTPENMQNVELVGALLFSNGLYIIK